MNVCLMARVFSEMSQSISSKVDLKFTTSNFAKISRYLGKSRIRKKELKKM